MTKPYHRWIEFLYGPFFKIIGFFYRAYKTNRGRVEKLTSREKVSSFIQYGAVILLLGWFLIWYFAPQGSGNRLTEEVKATIGGIKTLSE